MTPFHTIRPLSTGVSSFQNRASTSSAQQLIHRHSSDLAQINEAVHASFAALPPVPDNMNENDGYYEVYNPTTYHTSTL